MDSPDVNLCRSAEHALDYLGKADTLPHRTEGEAELLACLRDKPDGTESLGFKHHLLAFRTAHHDDRQRRPSFSHLSQ